jgi:hypothetical protein
MFWNRIVVLTDIIAGPTNNWIATHRHGDCALMKGIWRKLSEDSSSILQLERVIGRLKVTDTEVTAGVEDIAMTNLQMSSVAISQAIRDAPEKSSISRQPSA